MDRSLGSLTFWLTILCLLHLSHKLSLVVVLTLFSCIKLVLCDVFKCITWFHMYNFLSAGGIRLVRINSGAKEGITLCLFLILYVHIRVLLHLIVIKRLLTHLLWLLLCLKIGSGLHFYTTILLTLTWKWIMLSDDIAISISYRCPSSLISSTYSVIVCKFMHCFEIIFCFLLFASELLLLLLCDLSC